MLTMRYAIEATLNDGTTYKAHTGKIKRMSRLIRTLGWQKLNLRVSYYVDGAQVGVNEGTYVLLEDALLAWEGFIDPSVVYNHGKESDK